MARSGTEHTFLHLDRNKRYRQLILRREYAHVAARRCVPRSRSEALRRRRPELLVLERATCQPVAAGEKQCMVTWMEF